MKCVTSTTYIDTEVGSGNYWYDDYAYDPDGGHTSLNLNTWYNSGDPTGDLGGTTQCNTCPADEDSGLTQVHGWYYNTAGS